jgi:hypothetical protein
MHPDAAAVDAPERLLLGTEAVDDLAIGEGPPGSGGENLFGERIRNSTQPSGADHASSLSVES